MIISPARTELPRLLSGLMWSIKRIRVQKQKFLCGSQGTSNVRVRLPSKHPKRSKGPCEIQMLTLPTRTRSCVSNWRSLAKMSSAQELRCLWGDYYSFLAALRHRSRSRSQKKKTNYRPDADEKWGKSPNYTKAKEVWISARETSPRRWEAVPGRGGGSWAAA